MSPAHHPIATTPPTQVLTRMASVNAPPAGLSRNNPRTQPRLRAAGRGGDVDDTLTILAPWVPRHVWAAAGMGDLVGARNSARPMRRADTRGSVRRAGRVGGWCDRLGCGGGGAAGARPGRG